MTTTAARASLELAALEYAALGLPIVSQWHVAGGRCGCRAPDCRHPGKHPIGSNAPHGWQSATTDPAVIRAWWARFPLANIATATEGHRVVLDVDPRAGGDQTLEALEAQHGPLPATLTVHTPQGGRHLHFAWAPVQSRAGHVGTGLDIKALGGLVNLPPSVGLAGVYREDPDHGFGTPLAPMPVWLRAMAATPPPGTNRLSPPRSSDEWAAKLTGAPEGQRRAAALEIAGHFLGLLGPEREAEVTMILVGHAALCTPPFPESEARAIVRDLARRDRDRRPDTREHDAGAEAGLDTWPPPEPVPNDLPPVPAFDAARMLPTALAPWVEDIAERAQCPPDFVAVAAVIAVAAVVGRRLTIRPKRQDDWAVVPNLWGAVIGRPGIMKSPALHEALRPLGRLIADAHDAHLAQTAAHEFQQAEAEVRRDVVRQQLKEAVKKGLPTTELQAAFEATAYEAPSEPRLLVNDATVEKLGALLNENPNGLLLFRDELAGFLRTMEREGHESDRAFYNEAWNGTGAFIYDRIGRGTLRIEAACISVLGGIQPGPLGAYLRETFGGGGDDGLIQRFQLMVYPDVSATWRNVDRWPDTDARRRVVELFQALARLAPCDVAAHEAPSADERPFLRFAPEAQDAFDTWRAGHERLLRASDGHPVVISHLAKYRSLVPSLALLFHLLEAVDRGTGGPVTPAATERALAWATYLEAHARRVYESVTASAQLAARLLAGKLRAGALQTPFVARQLRRKQWTGLTAVEDIGGALDLLEGLGWLRPLPVRPAEGGRPTIHYHVNPAVVGSGR